ncbi:MAG: hypothetical protein ACJA1L_001242 [Paracoccaceae bacterium]|jgi:hypothetical protein
MLRVPPRRLYLSIAGGAWDIGADFRVGADPSSAIVGPLRGRGRAVRLARAPKGARREDAAGACMYGNC